jgi:hypothetical protein
MLILLSENSERNQADAWTSTLADPVMSTSSVEEKTTTRGNFPFLIGVTSPLTTTSCSGPTSSLQNHPLFILFCHLYLQLTNRA